MSDAATEERPLLSIIIPSFNHGRFLRDCLDSILSQDYRPIEIVVVDGGSRDETVAVLESYSSHPEVRWISEPDDGPADAVNKGLAMARGDLASIQSADDRYAAGAFARVVPEFVRDPGLGLLYGEVASMDVSGAVRSVSRRPPHDNALCIALCICIPQCSAFFRTALARTLGGWRKEYFTCDWDLWLRMMFRTRTLKVDDALSSWRIYAGQRTDQHAKVYESFRRMIARAPEVRSGGVRVRLAALAAGQLIAVSFGPHRGPWHRLYHVLAATLLYPWIWPYIPNKARFVPYRRLLSRSWNRLRGSTA